MKYSISTIVGSATIPTGRNGPLRSSLWDGALVTFCCVRYHQTLTQIPIRNFYARCFILFVYFSKVEDLMPNVLPGYGASFMAIRDPPAMSNIRNYDAVVMNQMQIIPDASNRIHEGLIWKYRQPAHMRNIPEIWIGTYFP
jgi:hypothetical protein